MTIPRRASIGGAIFASAGIGATSQPAQPYVAACVQTRIITTTTKSGLNRDALNANIQTIQDAIREGAETINARLLAFSEFAIQVQSEAVPVEAMIASALTVPGREIESIGKIVQDCRCYVVLNLIERIAAFPGRYFLSAVLLGPSGDLLTNYRKLYDLTNKTRPSDVLTEWLERFGPDSLFPVADTDLGRIACPIALDVQWPELVRSFVFKGAEIIVNPMASPLRAQGVVTPGTEGSDGRVDLRNMIRRVRAFENMTYLLTANFGPIGRDARPVPGLPSEIIDYRGRVLASREDGAEGFVSAPLDIEALRKARCAAEHLNPLAQLQVELHAQSYQDAHFATSNSFGRHAIRSELEHQVGFERDIDALLARGIFRAPRD